MVYWVCCTAAVWIHVFTYRRSQAKPRTYYINKFEGKTKKKLRKKYVIFIYQCWDILNEKKIGDTYTISIKGIYSPEIFVFCFYFIHFKSELICNPVEIICISFVRFTYRVSNHDFNCFCVRFKRLAKPNKTLHSKTEWGGTESHF